MDNNSDGGWKKELRKEGPRWVVLLIDLFLVWLGFVLSFILIFKQRGGVDIRELGVQSVIVLVIYWCCFFAFKSYRSIIRRTELRDLLVISKTVGTAFIMLFLLTKLLELIQGNAMSDNHPSALGLHFSQTQLLLHALLTAFAMAFARLLYKTLYHSIFWNNRSSAITVILFGAGNMGNIAFDLLQTGSRNRYRVVAIIDDKPERIGKRIHGMRVRNLSELSMSLLEQVGGAQELVVAIDDQSPERLQQITERAETLPLKLKIMPQSASLLEGGVATRQLRTLKVTDLLGRRPIELNNPTIAHALQHKVVLVTGGAGSIGSELVRQIAHTDCARLVVLDQAESALYDVQQELRGISGFERLEFIVGNVRDLAFMESVFHQYRPQFVFHAAAYKHVPLMEANPYEAILTNVWGSYNVGQLADKYGVEKFVMVSTDKAVNPTNVMGATKRIAEIAITGLNKVSNTNYIVTRFGNVLGSNGSVIPLFEKQIKKGGPITITHPDITRYFMTIPEACQLVQEAGIMGSGGEVFVFDMGEPVKIMDLAKKMIRLKGLAYPEDIDIKVVGLRPGEKIFEELLANDENTIKTHHEKIMIAQVNTGDVLEKKKKIDNLCDLVKHADPNEHKMELVTLVKAIVPEFRSQNSIFEELDGEKRTG